MAFGAVLANCPVSPQHHQILKSTLKGGISMAKKAKKAAKKAAKKTAKKR